MRSFLLILTAASTLAASAYADEWVNGYTRDNGTYVQGHERSTADSQSYNNYSTQGNTNPYTGQEGTHPNTEFGGNSLSHSPEINWNANGMTGNSLPKWH